jgi:hypothetical protein
VVLHEFIGSDRLSCGALLLEAFFEPGFFLGIKLPVG